MKKELIARYYADGLYTAEDLEVFAAAGYISREELEEIDGLER